MLPTRQRILLWAAASGLLWAAAWPAIGGLPFLAFFAWLPLLQAERLHDQRTASRPRAFVPYALFAVLIWNAASSWWFFVVDEPIGTRLMSGFSPMLFNTVFMCVPWWLKRVVAKSVDERAANYGFIFFWLAFEYGHHRWDLQWPWFSLGNVFGNKPEWIQWYAYTGMLGGSLWILLVTFFLDGAIVRFLEKRQGWIGRSVTAALIIAVPLLISYRQFANYPVNEGRTIEAVIVQPCVNPYTEKFGGMDPMDQLDRMLALAATKITDTTALVVMPETALQEGASIDPSGTTIGLRGLWENDLTKARSTERLLEFQKAHPHAALLAGMSAEYLFPLDAELPAYARPLFRGTPPDGMPTYYYGSYNAAIFLPSKGPVEHYNKSKLVAGVESMPFERVLGQLSALSVELGGTSGSLGQQEEREVLRDPANRLNVVPAICYESVFGEHVAAHVRNGGELIAIITNDAWWGDTPGYHQHLTFATIRAIETRRSVVRSANTGISCFVDRRGTIHQATAWWQPTAIRGSVVVSDEITFFVRHGDQVGRVAVLCSALLLLLAMARLLKARSGN